MFELVVLYEYDTSGKHRYKISGHKLGAELENFDPKEIGGFGDMFGPGGLLQYSFKHQNYPTLFKPELEFKIVLI